MTATTETKRKYTWGEASLALALALAAIPLMLFVHGWTLSTLWGWFVVPALGLPALSVPLAAGVYVIGRFFFTDRRKRDDKDEEHPALGILKGMGGSVVRCGFALGLGWLVLLAM